MHDPEPQCLFGLLRLRSHRLRSNAFTNQGRVSCRSRRVPPSFPCWDWLVARFCFDFGVKCQHRVGAPERAIFRGLKGHARTEMGHRGGECRALPPPLAVDFFRPWPEVCGRLPSPFSTADGNAQRPALCRLKGQCPFSLHGNLRVLEDQLLPTPA